MTTKKKGVASVAGYRKARAEEKEIELPSGHIFTIKVMSPMDYIKAGMTDIPNDFFRFLSETSDGLIKDPDSEDAKKNYEFFQTFLKATLDGGTIDPLVTLLYKEGQEETHLLYSELSDDDQYALISAIAGKGSEKS